MTPSSMVMTPMWEPLEPAETSSVSPTLLPGGNGGYLGVGVLGVAVDEHVDAGDLGENVNGAVARGLVADAEVAEADDVIAAVGHESVNLVLGVAVELVPGHEADADYLGRMGLGGGLGGLKAEEAYLGAADLDVQLASNMALPLRVTLEMMGNSAFLAMFARFCQL